MWIETKEDIMALQRLFATKGYLWSDAKSSNKYGKTILKVIQ